MKCILIVAAVVIISSTYGNADHGSMKCDGTELKHTNAQQQAKKDCKAKYFTKSENGEKMSKKDHNISDPNATCFGMCMYQGFGVIATDGKVDNANMANYVKSVFPEGVQAALTTAFTTCATANGANLAVSADGSCESYNPFLKCLFQAEAKECKWGPKALG